jgi:adenine/guanine phosphoribosyltransferase-like PRPP-binding protein
MATPTEPTLLDRALREKWHKVFHDLGAEWEYRGGDVCALHTLSGKVSDYYFNSEIISNNEEMLAALCREYYLPQLKRTNLSIDAVASYPPYGVAFAKALAQALGVPSYFLRSLAVPVVDNELKADVRILVVADDIFSGGSVSQTIRAVRARRCTVVPLVFAFGNFSGSPSIEGFEIFSVISRRVDLFDVADSPLVARGVRPVNAREYWAEFFAPKSG